MKKSAYANYINQAKAGINFIALFICILLSCSLTACEGFFDKDNLPKPAPLPKITPRFQPHLVWSASTGEGPNKEYLKMTPAFDQNTFFTTSLTGTVSSINANNGHINWRANTNMPVSSGASAGFGTVVITSRLGDVIALNEINGSIRWKTSLKSEVLAPPAIQQKIVIIKTIDGNVHALDLYQGKELWSFQQVEPSLLLRASSAPMIQDNKVFVGFANGNLAALNINNGQLQWLQAIAVPTGAFAIQRMIDIDADPLVFNHQIYAATYQGQIASLNWSDGKIKWGHDISSYTGMCADEHTLYISDAKSHIWAFNNDRGTVKWLQNALDARLVTEPTEMGNTIVVGDAQGYLHWLDKDTGQFVAQVATKSAIYARPFAKNGLLYAFTNQGKLLAYSLS